MILPLAHRRVLVTRARGQASALAALLAEQGAMPIVLPAIEIVPPDSWCGLDAALSSARSYDWLLFTSANAVQAFVQRARTLGISPHPQSIAAIGPATAKAVEDAGLGVVNLMPEQFVAEAFADALRPHCAGASMLLVRAAVARDVLPEALAQAGATVTIAEAYRNVVPEESKAALPALFARDAEVPLDAITFTSASTARNIAALMEAAGVALPADVVLASIGPVTSAEMRVLGLEPRVEAKKSTIAGLVSALAAYFSQVT